MTLMEVIEQCGARICEGSQYQWECFGPNARFIDFADVTGEPYCSVVHDTKTYAVYQIDCHVPGQDQAFKWTNPEFSDVYLKECKKRKIDPLVAWDEVRFEMVEEETIMQYIKDIGEMYYDDLPIPEDQL